MIMVVFTVDFMESSNFIVRSIKNIGTQKRHFAVRISKTEDIYTPADAQAMQAEIDSVAAEIKGVNKRIHEIEEELKVSSGDRHWQFLCKEKILLFENLKLMRAKKVILLKLLLSKGEPDSSATDTLDGDDTFQSVFEKCSASSCTASLACRLLSCLYNGMKAVSFNLPEVVRDILKQEVDKGSMESARSAIRNGIPRTMLPEKISETITSSTIAAESQPSIVTTSGEALQKFFTCHQDPSLTSNFKPTLSIFGADYGPATSASKPNTLVLSELEP